MKYSIGDLVYLKQSGEEGNIVSMPAKGMLEVEVNGVSFPVFEDDVEHPYLRWFTEKRKIAKKKTQQELPTEQAENRKQRPPQGVYLSFVPVYSSSQMEDVVEQIRIHLLNELATAINFQYEVRNADNKLLFRHGGRLEAFTSIYLHPISLEDAGAQPRYHWQLNGEVTGTGEAAEIKDILRIKAAKLFELLHDALIHNRPTFTILLVEEFYPAKAPDIILETPVLFTNSKEEKKWVSISFSHAAKEVLDLHTNKLPGYIKEMTKAEILRLQLHTAERFLEAAVVYRLQRVIIIHGVGKGVLRAQVQDMLAKQEAVKRYANEWEPKYGYGATIVWLR